MTSISFNKTLTISIPAGSSKLFRDADYQIDAIVTDDFQDITERLPSGVYYDQATNSFSIDVSRPAFNYLQVDEVLDVVIRYGVLTNNVLVPTETHWAVIGTPSTPLLDGPQTVTPEGPVYVIELQSGTMEGARMNMQAVQWHLEKYAPEKMAELYAAASLLLAPKA